MHGEPPGRSVQSVLRFGENEGAHVGERFELGAGFDLDRAGKAGASVLAPGFDTLGHHEKINGWSDEMPVSFPH
jgi:hypothetical protein